MGSNVQLAKVCETENDREQNKKLCNLTMGLKGKGVKQMRVNKCLFHICL
jgi:hypothetical protein